MTAAWTRRIVTGPIYKLDVRLDLYASSNSRPAALANYFNPGKTARRLSHLTTSG